MAIIVGVRIKNSGKLFYFSPENVWPKRGDRVIVETARGLVMGDVIIGLKRIAEDMLTIPLKPVVRIATPEDRAHQQELDRFSVEAFAACKEKIIEHNLDMKLVRVEPMFDNSKIMFYFTANQRIDFRDLVKDLATMFKTRIELRQIGVRDEAKIIGTLGICGRKICCASFLGDFQPVSIKMAKEQSLSLNPTKISGACGRLMCCLKYEQDFYEQMHKIMPKVGRSIETPDGKGTITEVNVIRETLTVRIEKGEDFAIKVFTLDQINNPEKYKEEKVEQSFTEFEQFIMRSREAGRADAQEERANGKQERKQQPKPKKEPKAERAKPEKQEKQRKQERSAKGGKPARSEHAGKPEKLAVIAKQAHQEKKQAQNKRRGERVKQPAIGAEPKGQLQLMEPALPIPSRVRQKENVVPARALKTFAALRRGNGVREVADVPMPIEPQGKKQRRPVGQTRKGNKLS